jgi:DNA transposition AAA+ family ATPase
MNVDQKELIKSDLERLIESSSANKVATRIGVSPATVSQIRNNNHELIADEMWRKIAAGIKSITDKTNLKTWNIVETDNFMRLTEIFADAQENSLVMAVCAEAGCGKSATAKAYADNNSNVYVISCNEYFNRRIFLQELLRNLGRNPSGDTVGEMMATIVADLKKADTPLLIFDEVDKLSDSVIYFFITLYNQLEDHCGIILMATDYFEKKIKRGLRLNKKGYKEIYSRIGRKFITLPSVTKTDILGICRANGIVNKSFIDDVILESDSDLRRVRRKVFAIKKRINRG